MSAIFGAMTQNTQQNTGFRPQQLQFQPSPPPQPRNQGIRNFFTSFFQAINIRNNNGRNATATNSQPSSLIDTILLRRLSHRSSLVSWKSTSFCVGEEMVLTIKVEQEQYLSFLRQILCVLQHNCDKVFLYCLEISYGMSTILGKMHFCAYLQNCLHCEVLPSCLFFFQ